MAELVDAQVSDTCIERCGGSSPLPGTMYLFVIVTLISDLAITPNQLGINLGNNG